MKMPNRRTFLKVLGGTAAAAFAHGPLVRAFAEGQGSDEFFIFIHASGGWDVTLWSDPRNELKGLVDPASTANLDTAGLKHWKNAPLGDGSGDSTFQLVKPAGKSDLVFGPAIGDLLDFSDRITLINGIEMNTVSHPDGTIFSATGRHLSGGRAVQSSIDTLIANELGVEQTLPLVSVRFPSWYIGKDLDPRALPVRVSAVGTVSKSLARSQAYDTDKQREAVTTELAMQAAALAEDAHLPDAMLAMQIQYETLKEMLGGEVQSVFNTNALMMAQPQLTYNYPFQKNNALNAAFAVEAMKKNVVRCVSFALGGIDTHNTNYENHGLMLQEIFDIIAGLVKGLDAAPHPTLPGKKLADHTHILVISDFCRTPQVNVTGGRDHYPNNSALVISPRFVGNKRFGKTDAEQLLPDVAGTFIDGKRAVTPPDILATFLNGMGIDERRYLREGEVIQELLKS